MKKSNHVDFLYIYLVFYIFWGWIFTKTVFESSALVYASFLMLFAGFFIKSVNHLKQGSSLVSKRQISLCKDFIKKTGYSGLFSIEFIRDKEGHDYFMEMNFRNDGNSICVTASGINLPYIWYLYCSGGEWKKELASSNFRPVYVMPEFADFLTFAGRSIPLTKWFSDWKKTDQFMEYDRLDPKPFFVEIKHLVQRAFKKVIRNIKL